MRAKYIKIDGLGDKRYYSDKEMKILHREDGPAYEGYNSYKSWWKNGKRHREDGPAVEWEVGLKEWYLNDKRHREDGPAIEWSDGTKQWWLNGKLHREDGPAIEYSNGIKHWYFNGIKYSEETFKKKINQIKTININGREFTIEELNSLIAIAKK